MEELIHKNQTGVAYLSHVRAKKQKRITICAVPHADYLGICFFCLEISYRVQMELQFRTFCGSGDGDWFEQFEKCNHIAKTETVKVMFVGDSLVKNWSSEGSDVWKEFFVPVCHFI